MEPEPPVRPRPLPERARRKTKTPVQPLAFPLQPLGMPAGHSRQLEAAERELCLVKAPLCFFGKLMGSQRSQSVGGLA